MNSIHNLVLASNSPRRKEIMQQAGYQFQIITYDFDESFPPELNATEVAKYLAVRKNKFYRSKLENQTIITADTTVILANQVYNKPASEQEALDMLMALSGKTHEVVSGVAISSLTKEVSFSSITKVTFVKVSRAAAEHYVKKFQPLDKAGAYGIQEWIGLTHIRAIEGSYFNVVGLPIDKVYASLKNEFGINPID